MAYSALLMNLHGLLRATGLLMPTLLSIRTGLSRVPTAWRLWRLWPLWPLWRELVAVVPEVTLTTPRGGCTELLFPPVPHDVSAYRKVIEIRDALLEPGHYIPPYASETSGVETGRTAVSGSAADIGRLSALVSAWRWSGRLSLAHPADGARRQDHRPDGIGYLPTPHDRCQSVRCSRQAPSAGSGRLAR
ncbi:DUF6545 domain-containing protein [Streptomyces sp. Inha503]|uniref:DUF6545 domain-containing protein n=1 Tax=Streptomyces sp. Inha503 TaxID=3383314 RepID=UPI0039A0239F